MSVEGYGLRILRSKDASTEAAIGSRYLVSSDALRMAAEDEELGAVE